ncbi:MAG: hypothetical protein KC593_15055 [Myxococcales bacterium]|nr:hypothetical protein [Myxococcales bacterium]MCB9626190.1 hypothetical protein [Sandaracinaceae bacterium]
MKPAQSVLPLFLFILLALAPGCSCSGSGPSRGDMGGTATSTAAGKTEAFAMEALGPST